jgi:hypothetical protein
MGTCGGRIEDMKRKYLVKIKSNKKKKKKKKELIEEVNFEIIDTVHNTSTEKLFMNNITLSELLTLVNYNILGDLDIRLKDSTSLNDDLNTNLKDIIEKFFPRVNLLTFQILVTIKGLSIPSNVKNAYQRMSPIIGNPIFENSKIFGVSLYYQKNNTLETFYFKKNDYKILEKFNSFTSFCSAKGKLYISGGQDEDQSKIENIEEEYNDFISIDMNNLGKNYLNKLNIDLLSNLVIKRSWHTMIFVPNQYIFIVGGLNTQTVEIYDIDKNEIYVDSELKEKRLEPTMCVVNNLYLYAFCGFTPYKNFNITIERCNLLKKKREWEYVIYSNQISGSFFGVSYFKDDEILLISSKDNLEDENKSYTFKIGMEEDVPDEINEIVLQFSDVRTFKDKLFYPIYENFSVNSPLISGANKNILVLNINTGDIESKNYK